jgi:hypothetical protein
MDASSVSRIMQDFVRHTRGDYAFVEGELRKVDAQHRGLIPGDVFLHTMKKLSPAMMDPDIQQLAQAYLFSNQVDISKLMASYQQT